MNCRLLNEIANEIYYASLVLEFLIKVAKDKKAKKLFFNYRKFNKRVVLRLFQTGFG